jgi:hypothetical protein
MSSFDLCARTRQLLRGPLKHVRKAALAGALVPLGSVALMESAVAQEGTSRVDATVTPVGSQFRYDFTVFNTSILGSGSTAWLIDWELPLFDLGDLDLGSVDSPPEWAFEILTAPYDTGQGTNVWSTYDPATDPLLDSMQGGDPNLYGPNPEVFDMPPYVLHWYEIDQSSGGIGVFPGEFLSGFSFISDYSSRSAPYMASWLSFPPRGGDPPIPGAGFGSPNSPARKAAQGVPEPSTLVLFVLAGSSLLVAGHRREKIDRNDSLN